MTMPSMKQDRDIPYKSSPRSAHIADLICLATWLSVCIVTWDAWFEPLVDVGRELYVPWMLASGQKLYADIAYFNGPVSPWWNTAWFKLLGGSVRTLTTINLCLSLIFTLILNRQLRKRFGTLPATMATLFFITVFTFPQITQNNAFNYIAPYSHEMTHGVYLSLLTLFILTPVSPDNSPVKRPLMAGILSGLVFMLKPELFIALMTAVFSLFAARVLMQHLRSPPSTSPRQTTNNLWSISHALTRLMVWTGGALLAYLCSVGLLSTYLPVSKALSAATGSWRYVFSSSVSNTTFYHFISGMDQPMDSILKMVCYAAGILGITLCLPGLSRIIRRFTEPQQITVLIAAAMGILATGVFCFDSIPWTDLPRSMPLLLCLVISFLIVRFLCGRSQIQITSLMNWLPFLVFSLVLLLKILLFSRFYHYGFVLGMPAALFLICFALETPETVNSSSNRAIHRCAQSGLIIFILLLALGHLYPARLNHQRKTEVTELKSNRFLQTRSRHQYLHQILSSINNSLTPDDTLAVLPQGAIINFLTGHATTVPYLIYMPTELAMYGETVIIDRFTRNAPDYILLRDRSTAEHGVEFGQSYGVDLTQWIEKNYHLHHQILPPQLSGKYGVQLLKRSSTSFPALTEQ